MRFARLSIGVWVAASLTGACRAGPVAGRFAADPGDVPVRGAYRAAGPTYQAAYALSFAGRRIGYATESVRRRGSGYAFERQEHVSIRRGERQIELATTVAIALDDELQARSVEVVRRAGSAETRGQAIRNRDHSWQVGFADEPARRLPAAAVPVELLPLLLARQPRFAGSVMLAGHGFATGELYAKPAGGPRRVALALVMPSGVVTNELVIDPRGGISEVIAPGAVESRRVELTVARAPFDAPELVDAAAIPIHGRPPADRDAIVRLAIEGARGPAPPALPAQHVLVAADTWQVTLATGFALAGEGAPLAAAPFGSEPAAPVRALATDIVRAAGARSRVEELRALAHATDRLIADDLAAPGTDAATALALGRGDCTAHARVFAAFARARGFDVRLVTGFRIDRERGAARLVRHRWAVVRIGAHWLAIDPSYGEVPAAPALLGLAVHGPSDADMAAVDDVAFSGFRAAVVRFTDG
jgi:transglutaminase-like putative cysteine protease